MKPLAIVLGTGMVLAATSVAAAEPAAAPAQGVVNLSTSATVELPKDWLRVGLSANREGPDAASVQSALKQALEAALAEARKAARPGQLEVQAGNFSLYPRYGSKGAVTGWQGHAELVVEGRDMPAIAQLTGRVATMAISGVAYSISREAREKVEGEVSGQAIARYHARAAELARQFGYAGYTIREVSVAVDEPPRGGPVPMLRMQAAVAADAALPVEPGTGTVTATVSGTVQLLK